MIFQGKKPNAKLQPANAGTRVRRPLPKAETVRNSLLKWRLEAPSPTAEDDLQAP
jgi:hypothetical protein